MLVTIDPSNSKNGRVRTTREARNFVCAFCACEDERSVFLRKIAKRREDLVEQFIDCLPARLRIGGYFAKHGNGAVAILVANEIGATVTVTLFTAENVK
jgi:hypothetical protein